MNDELDVMVLDQGDMTMHAVNNLMKKQVSWREDSLFEGLRSENIMRIWLM
jgi:hypothetical protein